MAWSRRQQIILAMVPKVSSTLSLAGSVWILTEVLTDQSPRLPKRKHPYHRLLLGMSVYDILESIWNFGSTWAIPRGTEGVWNPLGTTATCAAQGYFLTLSVAVPIYNAFLSLYYVMVINYGIDDAKIAQRAEPCMHAVAAGWAFFTATYSLAKGLLNNANLWCWIAPLPGDCLDSRRHGKEANCERGDNAWIYRWTFYFVPLWFCIFFATVCTIMVYHKVQKYDRITLKYRRPENSFYRRPAPSVSNGNENGSLEGRSSTSPPKYSTAISTSQNTRNSNTADAGRGEASLSSSVVQFRDRENSDNGDDSVNFSIAALEQIDEREVDAYAEETQPRRWDLRSTFKRWKLRRQIFREDNPRTAEVFQQALWYLGVFYITHVWSTTNRTIQLINDGQTYYPIIVMHSFFDPLQGFLNFLVYQRPRYQRFRKANPELGRWGAIPKVLQFSAWSSRGDEWVLRSMRRSISTSRWWRSMRQSRPRSSSRNDISVDELVVGKHSSRAGISSVSDVSELDRNTTTTATNHHKSVLEDQRSSVAVEASEEIQFANSIVTTRESTQAFDEDKDDECETNPQKDYEMDEKTDDDADVSSDDFEYAGDTVSRDSSENDNIRKDAQAKVED